MNHALVLGGTGAVGSAVVRAFAERGVTTTFTYLANKERALALATELGHACHQVDLRTSTGITELVGSLMQTNRPPNALVHCAGVPLVHEADADPSHWETMQAIHGQSALWATRALASHGRAAGGVNVLLLGALTGQQSVALPAAFAAVQGMLPALAMAMGQEFGPQNIRTNVVAMGLIGEGLSASLSPKLKEHFLRYSALRRLGTSAEVARAIAWLAINNTYVNGKVIPINGGV